MNIIFFYPSRNVGGVQTLFSHLASSLVSKVANVYVFDYENGIYKELISNDKVNIIPFIDGEKISLDDDFLLITPASNICSINEVFTLKNKDLVLFWMVHPFNLIVNFPFFNFFSKLSVKSINKFLKFVYWKDKIKYKNVIEKLSNSNSLFFMDYECFDVNRRIFDLNLKKPQYLPIPVSDDFSVNYKSKSNAFCWLGRVEDFKTKILIKVIDDFLAHSFIEPKPNFIVIGTGTDIEMIKLKYAHYHRRVIFVDKLIKNELHEYLAENVSVMFAMGTSSLESAKLSIPTILLDACYTTIPKNYRYRWLYLTEGFTLGRILDKSYKPSCQDMTFTQVIEVLNKDYEKISSSSYDYFKQHHSLVGCTNTLYEHISNLQQSEVSGLSISDFHLHDSLIHRLVNLIKKFLK